MILTFKRFIMADVKKESSATIDCLEVYKNPQDLTSLFFCFHPQPLQRWCYIQLGPHVNMCCKPGFPGSEEYTDKIVSKWIQIHSDKEIQDICKKNDKFLASIGIVFS